MSRKTSRLYALALALAVPAFAFVVFAPADASGDAKKPAAKASDKPAADRYDPDNITAISQYMEAIVKGNQALESKNVTGAIDNYKKAVQLNPRHPLGLLLLGEAYVINNNLTEAEAAFLQAAETADSKNPTLRSHVLFAVADVYERGKKWEQAKTAWQAYADHASKFADAGAYPNTAAERLKAIQKIIELEQKYAGVRERIAAEKDGGADGGKKK